MRKILQHTLLQLVKKQHKKRRVEKLFFGGCLNTQLIISKNNGGIKMKNKLQTLSIILILLTSGAENIFTALLFLISGSVLGYFTGIFNEYCE